MLKIGSGAIISKCENFRFALWRDLDESCSQYCNFVMLNPSTADALNNDRTVSRCIDFANGFGCSGLVITNLFSYRTKSPDLLRREIDPVGNENDEYISTIAENAKVVICAWGNHGNFMGRNKIVMNFLRQYSAYCLRLTQSGNPSHPLYLPSSSVLIKYQGL